MTNPAPSRSLDFGRVDDDPHRQPFGVDQGVDLAALHLLAGVVTRRIVFAAPFPADFTAMCSSTQIVSYVPSRWNLPKML